MEPNQKETKNDEEDLDQAKQMRRSSQVTQSMTNIMSKTLAKQKKATL